MITCSKYNCHIENSHSFLKKDFRRYLWLFRGQFPSCLGLWLRPLESLEAEWGVHNVLYRLGLFRSHTKDVDLNYPQRWSWLYRIVWALTKWIAR